jgi:hypothetical protein
VSSLVIPKLLEEYDSQPHHWWMVLTVVLVDSFELSLAARTRFQCCWQHGPVTLLYDVLPPEFVVRCELMALEQMTPNPTYCADAACASFILLVKYHGPDAARCRCGTET